MSNLSSKNDESEVFGGEIQGRDDEDSKKKEQSKPLNGFGKYDAVPYFKYV